MRWSMASCGGWRRGPNRSEEHTSELQSPTPRFSDLQESDHIVADYFAKLTDELVGRSFNKAARNRDLQAVIDRSKGSIEFKHQNISAVLLGLGQPWIEGYKPAANFQNALVDGVLRWLEARTEWLAPDRLSRAALNVPEAQGSLRIGPPPTVRNEPSPIDPAFMAAIGRKYDVAERDARNRALGKGGDRQSDVSGQRGGV